MNCLLLCPVRPAPAAWCLVLGLLAWWSPAFADGDLLVTPTRVVFEGPQQTAALAVVNTSTETRIYRISFVRRRMNETGEFEPADPPREDERFADEIVRVLPRQVVLTPGSSQTIRLVLRKQEQMADGEYRSHLNFVALPPPALRGTSGGERDGPQGVQVRLIQLYGVTVPVIVRKGNLSAAVRIEDVHRTRTRAGAAALALSMRRTGGRSVYGDLAIETVSGSTRQRITLAKGVAVYVPNDLRRIVALLPPGIDAHGRIRVLFTPTDGCKEAAAASEQVLP